MSPRILSRCLLVGAIAALASVPVQAAEWRVDLDPETNPTSLHLEGDHAHGGRDGAADLRFARDRPRDRSGCGSRSSSMPLRPTPATRAATKKCTARCCSRRNHPQIVFRPDHFEGDLSSGSNTGVVLAGEFELLGKSHQISVPLDHSNRRFTLRGEPPNSPCPMSSGDLKDPSTFVLRVAKEVQVRMIGRGNHYRREQRSVKPVVARSFFAPRKDRPVGVTVIRITKLGVPLFAAKGDRKCRRTWEALTASSEASSASGSSVRAIISRAGSGLIGLIPLATAFVSWCPAYLPFGISTRRDAGQRLNFNAAVSWRTCVRPPRPAHGRCRMERSTTRPPSRPAGSPRGGRLRSIPEGC